MKVSCFWDGSRLWDPSTRHRMMENPGFLKFMFFKETQRKRGYGSCGFSWASRFCFFHRLFPRSFSMGLSNGALSSNYMKPQETRMCNNLLETHGNPITWCITFWSQIWPPKWIIQPVQASAQLNPYQHGANHQQNSLGCADLRWRCLT